jgi:uncharacterized protein (DUF1015 family)
MLLESLGSGKVMPHENTMAGPKADRLRLWKACRASLSQVFGIFSDTEGAADRAICAMAEEMPLYEFADTAGVAHRLWRVTDAERIGEVAALLRRETLLIADGHHRYETALSYRDTERPPDAEPAASCADFLPLFCVSARDSGLVVLPTHRLVAAEEPWDAGAVARALRSRFDTSELEISSDLELVEAARERVNRAGQIGCFLGGGRLLVLSPSPREELAELLPARSAAWRELAVTRLHYGIIEPFFGIPGDIAEAHPRLAFTQDVAEVYWAVESGRMQAGFLLPATPTQVVEAIARAGERMPPKSTFFYPKIPSGLLFYTYDDEHYVPRFLPQAGQDS